MSRSVPYMPHCEVCRRPQLETPGMIGMQVSGMWNHICFDCVDIVKQIADAARRTPELTPKQPPIIKLVERYDPYPEDAIRQVGASSRGALAGRLR